MDSADKVAYADRVGQFYADQYGFSPLVGRLLGYLMVCDPIEQTIGDLADALLTSRSAIAGAVVTLQSLHLAQRWRPAGSRADLVTLDIDGAVGEKAFDVGEYEEQGRLAREGLELLKDASPARREALEEWVAMSTFLVGRMPLLWSEWQAHRKSLARTSNEGNG